MQTRTLPILLALTPVAMANADENLPITGVWQAEPSPDLVGPTDLTISKEVISFGSNHEKVTGWNTERDTVTVDTGSGHIYSFRQETNNRICLLSSLRPSKTPGSGAAMPVRCYVKRGSK